MSESPNRKTTVRTGKDIFNLVRSKQNGSGTNVIAQPVGEVQTALVTIWQRVLPTTGFTTTDDFFKVGGNSIKAVQLASQIGKTFKIAVQLTDIFLNPTIALQEKLVNTMPATDLEALVQPINPLPARPPLSFNQERLWFIHQLEGSLPYHLPLVFSLDGFIQPDALEQAIKQLVQRHETLRTVFAEEDGKPYQKILSANNFKLVQQSQPGVESTSVGELVDQLVQLPFDLSADYMLRATLISQAPDSHTLVLVIHHIAADGWSMQILANEMINGYDAQLAGTNSETGSLPLQYVDYAIWQKEQFSKHKFAEKLAGWKSDLTGYTNLNFPTDFSRPVVQSYKGAISKFAINEALLTKLQSVSDQNNVTLYHTLLAAFNVLLYRYTGQSDVCIGTVVANRPQAGLDELIGFFVNSIPLRNQVSAQQPFTEFVQQVKASSLQAFTRQDVPFEKIVETAAVERDLGRHPLFQIMFVLQNTPALPAYSKQGLSILQQDYHQHTAKFDITFTLQPAGNALEGVIEYCTDLFAEETIQRLSGHYTQLLRSIVEQPEVTIATAGILYKEEAIQLLQPVALASAAFPTDKTIVSLFEEVAAQFGDKAAVNFGNVQLTYAQLNQRANQLARHLVGMGVKPGSLVPLCVSRGFEMIVSMLGIVKAGAAYVPIDPEYPVERIDFIINDVQPTVVVCDGVGALKLSDSYTGKLVDMDELHDTLASYKTENINLATPQKVAYIIYTSGSTGKPKGVMVTHSNVVSLFKPQQPLFNFNEHDVWSLFHSFCFDFSVWEIYGALLFGGHVVIVPAEVTKDVSLFAQLLVSEKVTILNQTPGAFYVLQDHVAANKLQTAARYVIFGGEALNLRRLQYWSETFTGCKLVNMYGITETTVHVTYYEITAQNINDERSLIGQPLPTLQVLILDENRQLVPMGAPGEMYVAGAGVSNGYLNRPDLSAERFIINPFDTTGNSRLYKTGDLGKFTNQGILEYLGRIDDQVKIRGYRIELGEIETVLMQSGLVKQVVVLATDAGNGLKRLVGYVVPVTEFDKQALVAFLQQHLPEYMVPAVWTPVDSIPLTVNGKVDKKALLILKTDTAENSEYVAPATGLQQSIADIWQTLLNVPQVGITDNFFELGGDSILTIQVVSRINKLGYSVQPKEVFIYQTIKKLSEALAKKKSNYIVADQQLTTGFSGLLPVQQWYLQQGQSQVSYFNQSVLISIDKLVSIGILNKVFEVITTHHDALRFKYTFSNNQWIQEYGSYKPEVALEDVSAEDGDTDTIIYTICDDYQKSLSIDNGELVKVVLFKTPIAYRANKLLIIVHHLAIDGVSWRILLEDVEALLKAAVANQPTVLPNKTFSYSEGYDALVTYSQSNQLLKEKQYWQSIIKRYRPITTDVEYAPKIRVKETAAISLFLSEDLTTQLVKETSFAYRTDVVDLLLAALVKTFSGLYQLNDLVIATEGHGREDIKSGIDITRTIGWFTSIYPLLLQNDSTNISGLIKSVKEKVRQVPVKGVGFGILKYINKDEDLASEPFSDILFNYLGQVADTFNGEKLIALDSDGLDAKRSGDHFIDEKISIGVLIKQGKLAIHWQYSTKHFKEETIQRLASDYIDNLKLLIDHCKNQLSQQFTPSDFSMGTLITIRELDNFLNEELNGRPRKENFESLYQLSGLQQGMLFHSLYDSFAEAYIEQFTCDIISPDIELVKKSWAMVMSRHSILRTAFYADTFSVPVQCVYKHVELPIFEVDFREKDNTFQQIAVAEFEAADRAKGFQFDEVPLMRITFIRLTGDRYRLVWTYHHILLDGWSMPIVMQEFLSSYQSRGQKNVTANIEKDNFEDYIRYLERINKKEEEDYWRTYLKNVDHSTLLPFISNPSERNKGTGYYKHISFPLSELANKKLSAFAARHRLTVNTIMQGVWSYILHKYSGHHDITFGTIVSGRPDDLANVEGRVGMYINSLPLYSKFDGSNPLVDWLQQIQQQQVNSRQFQYIPLNDIQKWTGVKGDLFDTLLVFENYPFKEVMRPGRGSLAIENIHFYEQTNYPLSITINNFDKVSVNFTFNTSLLSEDHVMMIADHFENVFSQVISSEILFLNDIQLHTSNEERLLLNFFNDTDEDLAEYHTIIQLFELQVLKTPDAIAVLFHNEQLTYRQLNQKANQLALLLRQKGVEVETLVPICLHRSLEMIVGILGILKSGGGYVPIDPEYPDERISYILSDTNPIIILSSKEVSSKISAVSPVEIFCLDDQWEEAGKLPVENVELNVSGSNLAYVMYTSGSTGKPKGVMVEEIGLVNRLKWAQKYLLLTAKDAVLQKTTFCFDVSVWELLWPLIEGSKMVFASPGGQKDNQYLKAVIDEQNITMVHFVPSMLEVFLLDIEKGDLPNLKNVLCSGEALKPSQVNLFRSKMPHVQLHNLYGPTEAAIDVTCWTDENTGTEIELVPIGKPVSNTYIYIVDKYEKLLPVGIPGEIYIGGIQVCRGYLNKPELSAEKFVSDTFLNDPKARMYKTGDLAKWLPGGNIEYLGRKDDQVKIRGNRVELGEIETVILQHPSVIQATVTTLEDNNGYINLVGYIVPKNDFFKEVIIEHVKRKLPDYMVPTFWVELQTLPLTANGKLDKKKLPKPFAEVLFKEYESPRNKTEEVLVDIWQNLLGRSGVGISDNFFDLGGHSLLVTRLVSAIRKQLNTELAIKDLFVYPTIKQLSGFIDSNKIQAVIPPIKALPRPELVPLSFSQERLWFVHQLEGSLHYHLPGIFKLSGKPDVSALTFALQYILERHEVLRTVYQVAGGMPYQNIISSKGWQLETIDLSAKSSDSLEVEKVVKELINRPFDLLHDFMFRAALVTLHTNERLLVLTIHHIACDGWSLPIFMNEVVEVYSSYIKGQLPNLPGLPVQYADFAIWQRRYIQGDLLTAKLSYWHEKLKYIEPLRLPADFARPLVQSTRGAGFTFQIDKELSDGLQALSRQQGSTLFMTLLAALKLLLYKYTGQQDICIGTAIAGRQHYEAEGLIGFFINTLALRTHIYVQDTFSALLQAVKQTTLEAFEHQEIPFEKVVESAVKDRDLSRSPLFQVMLELQNVPGEEGIHFDGLTLQAEKLPVTTSKFDLDIGFRQTENGLTATIEYCTDLFKSETIKQMMQHYQQLMSQIVRLPQQIVGEIEMLSEVEKQQLIIKGQGQKASYPGIESISDLFEAQVVKTPDNIAVVFNDQQYTYQQLNQKANQVARYLQQKGVPAETLVPICLERSVEMIVAILGILKAGGAYVPIDPQYPDERIHFILKAIGSSMVIGDQINNNRFPRHLNIINISDNTEISSEKTENLLLPIKGNHLAYVIFTSGSTGVPKGVMVENKGVINLAFFQARMFRISEEDRVLQFSTIAFDTSVEEITMTFASGAALILVDKDTLLNQQSLIKYLQQKQVTVFDTTPSYLDILPVDTFGTLKKVIVGGEACPLQLAKKWGSIVSFFNGYGPTEATIAAIECEYDEHKHKDSFSIGKPFTNTNIYLVDEAGNLVPDGLVGEIWIGGENLARGYLNQPELTNEKFIHNKFSPEINGRVYKTGDYGRWDGEGNIEYLGRIDDQVKIRGYRIELGEIEKTIMQSGLVEQAVVVAKEDAKGTKRLVGYIVADDFKRDIMLDYLHKNLPDYMVPGLWMEIEALPLTSNGKIDRKSLPDPDITSLFSSQYIEPVTDTEKKMTVIWMELLKLDRVGVEDNFFEIGGHSLMAMRLLSAIQNEFEINVAVKELFEFTTIKELAKFIDIKMEVQTTRENTDYDVMVI